ncbi:MAG: PAS domain-containing protein [Herpetosiphonaceae bacterium]|nr:PAS domain-containing protein [Herpetosiphonaceae bacterium]
MIDLAMARHMLAVRTCAEELVANLGADPNSAAPLLNALTILEQHIAAQTNLGRSTQHPDRIHQGAEGDSAAGDDPHTVLTRLREVEAQRMQYHQVLMEGPTGICILDGPDQRYTFTNPIYEQVAGRTQVIGKTVREVFPELVGQGMYETLAQVYHTGIPFQSAETMLHLDRDGDGKVEDVYYALTFQPLRTDDGTITAIVAYVVDISDRRALDLERAQVLHLTHSAHQAADAERQRLLHIMQQAPAAICTLEGPDHVFTFTNPQYQLLVGNRDVVGQALPDALPEVVDQGFLALLDGVRATGIPFVGHNVAIQLDRQGTGNIEEAFLNFVYAPLRAASGAITGIFVHAVDVTELVRARQEAETAVVLRDQFFSVAAHELRTPLTTLLGTIQVLNRRLLRGGSSDERTERTFTTISAQGQRLARLINTLLDVARINQGHLLLELAPVDLGALVTRVIDDLRITLGRRVIEVRIPAEACLMMGDSLRLEQVLVNLVQNASIAPTPRLSRWRLDRITPTSGCA